MSATETRVADYALTQARTKPRHAGKHPREGAHEGSLPRGHLGIDRWRHQVASAPLSGTAHRVANTLALLVNWRTHRVSPGLAAALERAGSLRAGTWSPMSRSTWFEGLGELIAAGLVSRVEAGRPGRRAVYQLVLPERIEPVARRAHRARVASPTRPSSRPAMGPPRRTPVTTAYAVGRQTSTTGTPTRPVRVHAPVNARARELFDALPWALRRMEHQPRQAALRLLGSYLDAGWSARDITEFVQQHYDPDRPVWKPYGLLRSVLTQLPLTPRDLAKPLVVLDERLCPEVGPQQAGPGAVYARHCPGCRQGWPGHFADIADSERAG